jgi:large subunit ribosomal protein L1
LVQAIAEFKARKIEYKADKTGIVHVLFGKSAFSAGDLLVNLKTLQDSIESNRPSRLLGGRYWRTLYLIDHGSCDREKSISGALRDIKSIG